MAQTISRIVFIIMSWRFFDYMDSFFDTEHLQRTYFKMAFPVMLGLVVTLIYNLADTYFIARTNNTNLIAGVSLCAPVFTSLWLLETFMDKVEALYFLECLEKMILKVSHVLVLSVFTFL